MKKNSKKLISIISPVYNEESSTLNSFIEQVTSILTQTNLRYEIILVNDGSDYETEAVLNELAENNKSISIVHLSRNFGHQLALSAGIQFAKGDAVILMDSDLQDDPIAIPLFIEKWEEGYDVVYAIRTNRKESNIKKLSYQYFYKILNILAPIKIPHDSGDFSLINRNIVDHLNQMPEKTRFLRGLRSWVGYNQIGIEVERSARFNGDSKFTIPKLLNLAFDGIFSFSIVPLRIISLLGFFISFCSILLTIFYAIKRVTIGLNPPGFATIIVMLSFFSGIQLFTIGLLGEYLGRVFEEVKGRPLYIVKKTVNANENTNVE